MDKQVEKMIRLMNLKVSAIENVPESYSSKVYKLQMENGAYGILKLPYNKRKFYREWHTLNILSSEMKVPNILDAYDDGEQFGFLLSFIEGMPATGVVDKDMAYQFGENLARLHEIQLPSFGDVMEGGDTPSERIGWMDVIEEHLTLWIKETDGFLEDHFHATCIDFFQECLKRLPAAKDPRLCHYDYRPGNILVHEKQVVGIIDFESSRGGSPALDFTKMKTRVWDVYKGTEKSFLEGYRQIRVLPDLESELPFYEYYHAFGGIAWCLRRGETESQFMRDNLEQVKRILEENTTGKGFKTSIVIDH